MERYMSCIAILLAGLALPMAYAQEDSFDTRLEIVLHDVCSVAAKIYTVRIAETEDLREESAEFSIAGSGEIPSCTGSEDQEVTRTTVSNRPYIS